MSQTIAFSSSPLNAIPDPDCIRGRLSTIFIEVRFLRRLLRLSQDARREGLAQPANRQEARHAG